MSNLNRRSFIVRAGAGATAVTTLSGCTGGGDGGGGGDGDGGGGGGGMTTSGSGGSPTSEQYTSRMAAAHYPVLLASTSTIVAEEEGFFEEYNVTNDEVTSFSGGGTTVRGVVTGGLSAGKGALMAVAKAYEAGAPAHLVGMMMAGSTIGFYSLPDSDVESIQDLNGGKIGLSNPGGSSEAVALKSVDNADGITLDDVEFVYAGGLGEAITSLNEGNVDVIFLPAPVSTQMKQEDEVREIWHSRDLAPNVTEHVMFMGQRLIEEERPLAEGIVRAHSDAMDFVRENPEESARMWANASDNSEEIAVAAMQEENPDEIWRPQLTEDIVKGTGEAMILQGLVEEQPPWQDIIRQELLPEDKRVDWV